ncbi:MFS transporter [Cupriavidus pauculus]|uniref:MFS transporter n=1 Tax=Cupriavidus pauculus TaxID=82633 RepID=A0A5P2H9S3_9BURK|nr:MFS transporter [Cupriavidus pauculus]QET04841.1 MFS transporter [Cupriavidus pauculus]
MTPAGNRPDAALQRVLWLLAPAIALVVGSEFIVVGLLHRMAADLDLPLATAGQLTALFALAAAVAGPFVTLGAGRYAPRRVLIAGLVLFAIGNAVLAATSSFALMLLARIAQGAVLPAFISVGAAEVARLAPPSARGRALARANLGFVLGVLIALPAGIALAEGMNWRLPFIVLAVAPVLMAMAIAVWFPRADAHVAPPAANQLGLLRSGGFIGHLLASVALFAAMFAAYTYLGVWLESVLGLRGEGLALALLAFGAIGLGGNALAGRFADRTPLLATAVVVIALAVSVNAASWTHGLLAAAIPLAIWSLTHTAGVTLSQVRVTLAGAEAPAFAMTLNVSAANLGIALGASAGGWAIDRWSLSALGVVPGGLAVLVLGILYWLDAARGAGVRARAR